MNLSNARMSRLFKLYLRLGDRAPYDPKIAKLFRDKELNDYTHSIWNHFPETNFTS